ncbi:MAG: hypothetical protein N3D73_02345 [Candidatus Diapherotrites archaeon]|nr:hypothetical protein [Candidatus Diapherotrites archaeon]
MEDDDLEKATRRLKSDKNNILTPLLIAFILGLLLGAFLQHFFLEETILKLQGKDYDTLKKKNEELDRELDRFYKCIIDNNISPTSC